MVREMMALSATAEPRLMRLMTMPKRKETMTALRGMGKLGETCGSSARAVRVSCCQYGLMGLVPECRDGGEDDNEQRSNGGREVG